MAKLTSAQDPALTRRGFFVLSLELFIEEIVRSTP